MAPRAFQLSQSPDSDTPEIECSLRAFALRDGDGEWLVRIDVPPELDGIDAEGFDQILSSVGETLAGLRGLNQHTQMKPSAYGELQLVIRCTVRASRGDLDQWTCALVFTWPPEWSELGRGTRDLVFESMMAAFAELRAGPKRPRLRGWEI